MSDTPPDRGWWQALDGKWYPPDRYIGPAGFRRDHLKRNIIIGAVVTVAALVAVVVFNGTGGSPSHTVAPLAAVAPTTTETPSTTVVTSATAAPPTTVRHPTTTVRHPTATVRHPPTTVRHTTTTVRHPTTTPSTGSLVTPAVEQSVLSTTWTRFVAAFAADDLETLAATSTPSVQQVVAGWFSCGCSPWPAAVKQVSYSAPAQARYPLTFYAEIPGAAYGGTPLVKEVIFSQASRSQPWMVTYLGGYLGAGPLFGTSSANVYVTKPANHLPSDISNAPRAYAAFFQQVDQTGTAPPLPPSFTESGVMRDGIAAAEATASHRKAQGLVTSFSDAIQQVGPVFAVPQGNLVCASMQVAEILTARPGVTIVQPANRSAWGKLLPPGSYHTLKYQVVYDVCFLDQANGSISQLTNMGGPIKITGT